MITKGSIGEEVKLIQKLVGVTADGAFGLKTFDAVKKWQSTHGLTPDGMVGEKTWKAMFPGKAYPTASKSDTNLCVADFVTYDPINTHITACNPRTPKYLVLHFTAGASSKPGKAKATRNVFLNRLASADFCVDDKNIIQVNPNIATHFCWAVGDGKGQYGITNANSISIEMCSTLDAGTDSTKANHEGWHITDAVLDNTVKLAKVLMKKYNIDINHVIRHYDASRKSCPGLIGWNDNYVYNSKTGKSTKKKNNSKEWEKFKARLA